MTRIRELVEQAVTTAREVKEASAKRGDKMLAPTFAVFRGNDRVGVVMAPTGGFQPLAQCGRLCISGFAADTVVLTHDTWTATTINNPRTGQEWGAGEMQEAVEKYQGLERGWIQDAISVVAVNRAGDVTGLVQPYRKQGRHRVEWLHWPIDKDLPPDEVLTIGGRVPAALVDAMKAPPLSVVMEREGAGPAQFGLNTEQALAHGDLGVAQVLTANGATVVLESVQGTIRAGVLAAAAARGKGERL